MKNRSYLLVLFFLCSFQEKEQEKKENRNIAELKSPDKEYLLNYYEETRENLREATAALNSEQLQYKSSEEKWSIAQCLEHIILTEEALFAETLKMLAQPANPDRRAEVKGNDQDLIMGLEDRSQKFQAPEELQPDGHYSDPAVALEDFEDQRKEIIDLIEETSEEDLRNHITDSPFGPLDTYRNLLFLAGHTARHTKQIEEILADPGFPSE